MNYKTLFFMLLTLSMSYSTSVAAQLHEKMRDPEYRNELATEICEKLDYPKSSFILGYQVLNDYYAIINFDEAITSTYNTVKITHKGICLLLAIPKISSPKKKLPNSPSCSTYEGWPSPDAF